ncbi:MAG: F420-0--gamma-glutamyl ligase [Acutalibacteraceae bacterium]|nr:F420-0--gamma-glutamyl ligase [Acutalibacteraceae bacterium]
MEFYANEGKKSCVEVNGKKYMRHSIKTHFVKQGEDYVEVFKKYVSPIYQEGDIVSTSEKIIALCQNRVIKREELKIGFWAKLLSKFASHPDTGYGVGETIKMQYAIHEAGLPKVLWASFASAVTKLFGKKGVFYEIVGAEVSGLDGFYDKVWDEYGDIGIKIPENPNGVCNELKEKLGMSCIIVDANDLGQELLGASDDLKAFIPEDELIKFVRDNPSGQGKELTPIILIRPLENFEKNGDTLAPGVKE